jgi:hypothetical protein
MVSSKVVFFLSPILSLMACQSTAPMVTKATPNLIAISYKAYDTTPTLTPEALDLAIEHCKAQGGLFANYRGATAPNPMVSAEEVHTFVCEKTKTDDNAVIAAQNERYMTDAALSAAIMASTIMASSPTQTQCTTIGGQTNCTSY